MPTLTISPRHSDDWIEVWRTGLTRSACAAMTNLDRPNLYDLFLMHAEARGEPTREDGTDAIFSVHEGVTPFDTNNILSEYLA